MWRPGIELFSRAGLSSQQDEFDWQRVRRTGRRKPTGRCDAIIEKVCLIRLTATNGYPCFQS